MSRKPRDQRARQRDVPMTAFARKLRRINAHDQAHLFNDVRQPYWNSSTRCIFAAKKRFNNSA